MAPASRTPLASRTPRRTSFTNLEQEADGPDLEDKIDAIEDEDDSPNHHRSPSEKARGKQRASYAPLDEERQDEYIEPEISHALDDVEMEPISEEDVGEEPPPQKVRDMAKAAKNKRKENEGAPRGRPRKKKEVLREGMFFKYLVGSNSQCLYMIVTPDDNTDGLRRSKRRRYSPLAWWRLEKVVYGRRENGVCLVPSIKEIHRIPVEKPEPLGAKKRKFSRKKSQTVERELQQVVVYDPEEGWDDETDPHCSVLEYGEDGLEVDRRECFTVEVSRNTTLMSWFAGVAFTAKMVAPKAAAQGAFYFQKVFGDGDFLAAGQLIIPPNSTKPTKGTKDNTFVRLSFIIAFTFRIITYLPTQVFYVIQGAVKFCVHKTNFILATGGMFMIPRGRACQYFIVSTYR